MKRAIKFIIGKLKFKHSRIAFSANWDFRGRYGKEYIIFGQKTLIANSNIDMHVSIENGSTIYNSTINSFVTVHNNSKVFLSKIGKCSYISYGTTIRNADIGKFCSIGYNVTIGLGKHPTNFLSTNPLFYSEVRANPQISLSVRSHFNESEKVIIGNDVWIGAGVMIGDGVKIGNGAIVAAGAVVVKDVEPYSVVGGVPAKFIKFRFDKDICHYINSLNWWDWPIDHLKNKISLFQSPIHSFDQLLNNITD